MSWASYGQASLNCTPPAPNALCTPPATVNVDVNVPVGTTRNWSDIIATDPQNITNTIRIRGGGKVIVPNGNVILNGASAVLNIEGVEFIINNGNLQLDVSGSRYLQTGGALRTFGNFQQTTSTVVCITGTTIEIGEEEAGGRFNTTGNNNSAANWQNDGGYRYLLSDCINVTQDYQLQSTGSGTGINGVDVIIDCCIEIGDRGVNHATPTAFGSKDGDDSGNWQSNNTQSIYGTEIVVANGNYQNSIGTMTLCNVDIKVNVTGSLQNNSGTIRGQNLCVGVEDILENSATWTCTVKSWYSQKQNSTNVPGAGAEASLATILACFSSNCCAQLVCVAPTSVSATASPGSVAPGATVTLAASASNTTPGSTSYTWSGPGINSPTATTSTSRTVPAPTTAGTYAYTVLISRGANCTASATASLTVVSVALPAIAVNVATPVCNSTTNNYTATGTVSLTNATAGSLTITDNGASVAVVSVMAGQTTVNFSVSGVSNGPATRIVVATLTGGTTTSTTYAVPASCTMATTPVCSISASAEAECHNNGTLDNSTDDYFTFILTPYSALQGGRFTVSATQAGNPVSLSLSDGSSLTTLSYAYPTPFRTPIGAAGNGTIILTLTDFDNATCTAQVTVADPGPCAVTVVAGNTPATVAYVFQTPFTPTELTNVPLTLPQFDTDGGKRILTGVQLQYVVVEGANFLFENTAALPVNFRAAINGSAVFKLAGNTLANLSFPASLTTGLISLPAALTGDAQGTYPGDVPYTPGGPLSTLAGMRSWLPTVQDAIFTNPTTDPRWVSNATGIANTDDDIYVWPPQSFSVSGSNSYSAPADLAPFVGMGLVDLTATTLNDVVILGGDNSLLTLQRTRAYAYATVIYTYTTSTVCSLTATANPGTCNPATGQYEVTGVVSATGAEGTTSPQMLTITVGSVATVVSLSGNGPVSYTLSGLNADGGVKTLTITSSASVCGTTSTTYTAPVPCGGCRELTVVASANSSTVAEGASATLTALVSAAGSYTFAWVAPNGVQLAGAASATATTAALPSGVYTFTVSVTSQPGCTSTAVVCVSVPLTACAGSNYAFSLTTTAGLGVYEWHYTAPGSSTSTVVQSSTANTYLATQAGQYGVALAGVTCPNGSCCPIFIAEVAPPVGLSVSAVAATCSSTAPVASGNAQLVVSGPIGAGNSYNVSSGATYQSDQALFTTPQSLAGLGLGSVLRAGLANPSGNTGDTYTVRVFTTTGCFADTTVTIPRTECGCPPPKCVPISFRRVR